MLFFITSVFFCCLIYVFLSFTHLYSFTGLKVVKVLEGRTLSGDKVKDCFYVERFLFGLSL